MPRSRSVDGSAARSERRDHPGERPSGEIAWIDAGGEPADADVPTGDRSRLRVVSVIVGVLLIALVSALFLAAVSRLDEPSGDAAASPDPEATRPSRQQAVPTPTQAPSTERSAEEFLDQLPTTPVDWLSGQVMAWVDDNGNLRARRLVDGTDLPVSVLAQTNLPPLPDHIHLLGAENSTWLFDLQDPERSGKLSNTVRMVRLGSGLDSYAFSSTSDAGATEFFVGSLWGPAMNGLAEVDSSTTVLSIPGTGVISSGRNATSEVLRGSGFEALPTRLGRIVAASASLLAGIHCDDLGRCEGRVAAWDGEEEQLVDAALLASPVVRISPDSRFIVAGGGPALHLIDLELGSQQSWSLGIAPDDSLTWSSDSKTVFFVVEESVVAVRVDEPVLSVSRVRSAGSVGARLPGADVRVIAE